MEGDSRAAEAKINGSTVQNHNVGKDSHANGTSSSTNGHAVRGATNHDTDEGAPRDSIQSGSSGSHSTSMSSLTVSTAPRSSATDGTAYGADFPTKFSPMASPCAESPKPHVAPFSPEAEQDVPLLAKTLSFRTDSTGSMGSLISNLNLSEEGTEAGCSTPDSSYETPPNKRNQNQNSVSSASILISALKNRRGVVQKKSVSFSLPSEDDIARKAQKMNSALLYNGLEEFDDNMLDYQISSPKSSLSGQPRVFTSPVRSKPIAASVTAGIAAMQLSTDSTKTGLNADGNDAPAVEPNKRPPYSGAPALGRKASLRDRPETRTQNLPAPPSGRNSVDPPPTMTAQASGSQPRVNPADASAALSSSGPAPAHDSQAHHRAPEPPVPPTLMERIAACSTAEELCRVFDITSESVFTGEIMTKRFSRDIVAKDRFVWIVPRTKSIHWAKDAKDRLDNHKVKYFLLDKNSPHINTAEMLSSASSCKEDPARRRRPPLPSTPSPERTKTGSFFDRAELLSASGGVSGSGDEAGFGAPEDEPGTGGAAAESEEAKAASSYAVHGVPERASGELVGIIHSAVISHLSIKIKTESGDYLSLTIKSNSTAVQRAKDWFTVIKTLTKDVSLSAQDTNN